MASSFVLKQLRCSLTSSSSSSRRSLLPFHPAAPDIRRRFTTTTTSYSFSGFLIRFVEGVLLNRVPHTLCKRDTLDSSSQILSLSIPGIEKRKETDESLDIFLDMDLKDWVYTSISLPFNPERGTLFINVEATDKHNLTRYYTGRINIPKYNTYKTIHIEDKDDGLILTLHKSLVCPDGTLRKPVLFKYGNPQDIQFIKIDEVHS